MMRQDAPHPPMMPRVDAFPDPATATISYVVSDPETGRAAVIDPVLGFDPASGRTDTGPADRVIAAVERARWTLDWIIETHIHADHLSAAPHVQDRLGGRVGIGAGVTAVQARFARLFNLGDGFPADGSQFDHLFADGETFALGGIPARVLHTPGHTPSCACFVFGDAAFVGDALFMPDRGTGRCDFPDGSAGALYDSLARILALPPETRLFVCHDDGAGGARPVAWQSDVAEQLRANVHCRNGVSRPEYVAMREARDAALAPPRLMLPALQVNIRAGRPPPADSNGTRYLKIPLDALE